MSALLNQLLSLVAAPPGNAIFHLVIVFSVASALQASFTQWRSSDFPQARRATLGLGVVLLAQGMVFVAGFLLLLGLGSSAAILPPLDRAVTLFSIVWLIWLWTFPEPLRLADTGVWLASLVVLAALMLSLISWSLYGSDADFNQSPEDRLWQANSFLFIGAGLFLLFRRRPNGFANAIAFFVIALLGHAAHLVFREPGDYSGVLRLAYLVAFPLLLTLPQRFPLPTQPVQRPAADMEVPRIKERRRYSTDPKTLQALLDLAAEENHLNLGRGIVRSIGHAMLADLCFLLTPARPSGQSLQAIGYDLIREEILEAGHLKRAAIPMIADAIDRGRALRLPASSTSEDIVALGKLLGLERAGHLLCVPLRGSAGESLGAILLLSPHSDRAWSADDQRFLSRVAYVLPPLLERGERAQATSTEVAHNRVLFEELQGRNEELARQLDQLRSRDVTHDSVLRELESTKVDLDTLRSENEQLRLAAALPPAGPSDTQLEEELRKALEDVARLDNQLAEANHRTLVLEMARGGGEDLRRVDVLVPVSYELRRVVNSVLGYTDLLLGESVGMLGVLQRKFIERIKTSTEQMGNLLDDIARLLTSAQEEPGMAWGHGVDINTVIDNAMSETSDQVREKNISIHIDVPKRIAPVQCDATALQRILVTLLRHAGTVTPEEGAIKLAVQATRDDGSDYLLVQVTDSGHGISSDELPRVFADTEGAADRQAETFGVSLGELSEVKALADAQNVRIWVDNDPGAGSTFSLLLPLAEPNTLMEIPRNQIR